MLHSATTLKWESSFKDIHVLDDGLALHVPTSSCHGGFVCFSTVTLSTPGSSATFLVEATGQSRLSLCSKQPSFFLDYRHALFTIGDYNKDTMHYLVECHVQQEQYLLQVQRVTCSRDALGNTVPDMSTLRSPRSATRKREECTPMIVCCSLSHGSMLRTLSLSCQCWTPELHATIRTRGFRAVVLLVMMIRDAQTVEGLALMPPELMFLVFEFLLHAWDLECERTVSSSLDTSSRPAATTAPCSLA
jgi:hypothetical protein